MAYLERNAAKRVDPQQVLAKAKSIITLAVSYAMEGQGSDDVSVNRKSQTANRKLGMVARYARFDDYHDVLDERLKHWPNS